jgi:hypothetical protein
MTRLTIALLLLLSATPRTPVAVVAAVKGSVTLRHHGRPARPAAVMDPLYAGDRLAAPAEGGATVIFFANEHRERLKPKAQATVGTSGCSPAGAVEPLKPLPRGASENLAGLLGMGASGRAGATVARDPNLPPDPPRVTPMFGATLLDDRPTFTWPAFAGATGYRIHLVTGGGKPVWGATTAEPRLPYPESEKPLARGREYSWYVKATVNGAEQLGVESRFAVILAAERVALAPLERLAASQDPADLLPLVIAYQRSGVYEETLALYERLAQLQPDAPFFPAAMSSLYERAGRPDDAKAARERAARLGYVFPGESK